MDTKWKRSKGIVGALALFLGLSLLAGCILLNPLTKWTGIREVFFMAVPGNTWQDTAGFRENVAETLNDLIRIGAGQPLSYGPAYVEAGQKMKAAAAEQTVIEEVVTSSEEGTANVAYANDFAGNEREWKPEEIREMAENFHQEHRENKNLLYELKKDGKVLYSNLDGETVGGPKNILPKGYDFLMKYDGEKAVLYRNGVKMDIYGDQIYEDDGKHWRVPGYQNYKVPKEWDRCEITLAVRSVPVLYTSGNRTYDNIMYSQYRTFESGRAWLKGWCCTAAAGLILLLLSWLCRKERKETEKRIGRFLSRIPLEIRLAALALLCIWSFQFMFFALFLIWPLRLLYLDCRYGGKPWKNSFVGRFLQFMDTKELELDIQERLVDRSVWPVMLCLATVFLLFLGLIAEVVFCIVAAGALFLALVILLIYNAVRQKRLAKDLGLLHEQIADACDGRNREAYELPADSDLAQMAQKVNGIRDGLEKAVEERLQSERMKVELVANVSHDIKTPLTSIISYVDLLREEENLPEDLKDYVQILAEKSDRLKNMVQDIFEVSKAASGQLPVKMEELDLGKLLRQTIADMAEQIDAASVTLKTQIPEAPVWIMADGQRIYRVFQNLLQNALQYSLEGSRIYLTLEKRGNLAVAGVRNTSKAELDGGTDFTERFVRGDASRSDGGSGLGLSIAKSFTEACGGAFKVETIADLFVVKVEFNCCKK